MQNSRQSYVNLALATAAFTVAFAAWSIISPLARQIQVELRLDNAQVALLIGAPTLLGALMCIPLGALADRFGGRNVFTGLLLFTLLPVAYLGFAHTFWSYLAGAFFLGTAGASFAVGVPFVSRWFTADRRGTALGIYGVGTIGMATIFAMVPVWFYLIPLAIMSMVFWMFARDAPGLYAPQPFGKSLVAVAAKKETWHLGLFYFVTFGSFMFVANYLPPLRDWFPADRRDTELQAAIFAMGATLARPAGGWLSDQLGGGRVLMWVFTLVVATRFVLAWQAQHVNIAIITDLMFVIALGFGIGNGAVFKLVGQYFPKNTGLAAGLVGAAGGLGGFFPPIVMGAVMNSTGSYALGFVILATLAAFCLALLLEGREPLPVSAMRAEFNQFDNGR